MNQYPTLTKTDLARKDAALVAGAHDTFWEFTSRMPGSMNLVVWLVSGRRDAPSPGGAMGCGTSRHGPPDHYGDARAFYAAQPAHEQARIACALLFELSRVHRPLRKAIVGHLRHVDEALASRIAGGLGMEQMPSAPQVTSLVVSKAAARLLSLDTAANDVVRDRVGAWS